MRCSLHDVCCASLPPESLAALAAVRDHSGVTVALAKGRVWVRWNADDETILRAVMPIAGVVLYVQRKERWYQYGRSLPAFDFPANMAYQPLHHVLTPAAVRPLPPLDLLPQPVALRVVADVRPRPTTALRCDLGELARWADTVPADRLATIKAACCNQRVLLVGPRLPLLAGGQRFWGDTVLVPLGCRAEPDLPASALREALGVATQELLLIDAAGAEALPLAALQPLNRAGLRLALGETIP